MADFAQDRPAPQSHPIIQTSDGPRIYAYENYWPVMDDIQLELTCYRIDHRPENGGLGKFKHMMKAHNIIWPHLVPSLHEWTFLRFKELCKGHQVVTLAGGAGTAKSADVARYALLWWWAYAEKRTVLVCSTTISALTKRIWSYIAEGAHKAHGNLPRDISISPPPKLLWSKKDPKHGVHGAALKDGNAEKTLADIIGIHPEEGLLLVVDEATDVTPGITDVITNLDSGGVNFQMVLIGNSKSRLDPHGKLSKPKLGWNSIDPDKDEVWETENGICIYSDCYKSPAVLRPNYKPIQFLITRDKIAKEEKRLGLNDPKFWRFVRGFWPSEDLTKTVLSLAMIEQFNAQGKAHWAGMWKHKLAGLDPAFTASGDECILRYADMGVFENGLIGLDFGGEGNITSLQLDSTSNRPISYQIVEETKKECIGRGVEPQYFGADTWGIGIGAGDIFEEIWSRDFHRIMGVGAPSDAFVDSDAGEKAHEVYADRTTELWFALRTLVLAGQVRGLDDQTVEELCSREYSWKGRKMVLESKKDYKKRMGMEDGPTGSPDRADAAVIIVEVARQNGLVINAQSLSERNQDSWEKRWEIATGHRDESISEDPFSEAAWDADGILGSDSWQGDGWDE